MNKFRIYGLIISAGLSGRMNRFKPLAEYKGRTFTGNIILKLDKVCESIIIVTGNEADRLKSGVLKDFSEISHKLKFIHNDLYKKGMFTSLQKGLQEAKECDWFIYHFVDQPGLPENFYPEFISEIDENYNWIQPSVNKRTGHPILINKELFDFIVSQPAESNLREISSNSRFRKKFWECGYNEIFQDIDTDDDYLKLIE